MNRKILTGILAASAALALSVGADNQGKPRTAQATPGTTQGAPGAQSETPVPSNGAPGMTQAPMDTAPEGFALVQEEVIYMLPQDYPDQHMLSASKSLDRKDTQAASKDVRKATGFLRTQASRSGAQSDSGLQASIQELEAMAASLEAGTTVIEKELTDAFARAHLALAAVDQDKASEHLSRQENQLAGRELQASARHLEKSAEWSGAKLDRDGKMAVKDAGRNSGRLIKGTGYEPDKVNTNLDSLDNQIKKQSRKLERSRAPAMGSLNRAK